MARRSLAKAVFDNVAETPNELAFRRGDVLAVISQTVPGLDGWWHCSFRGKQGIAPGNRLQLLAGMYPAEDGDVAGDVQIDSAHSSMIADYDVPRAHVRHETSAAGSVVSSARASTDSAFSFTDGLYDQLPATRGLASTAAAAATTDASFAAASTEPVKVSLGSSGTSAVPIHQRGKEASRSADAAAPPSQQQQRSPIRDLTYDVPLSLQQRSRGAAGAAAAAGVGSGVSDAVAKKDLRTAAAPVRDVEYDIPMALIRSRMTAGATMPSVAATQTLRDRSPPSSDCQLYDVPQQQQQHRWTSQQQQQPWQQATTLQAPGIGGSAGTRASGLSVASSTTSWSSSGCGAEGSVSSGTASARSSLELLDIYDVPRALTSAGAADRWQQRRSGGSGGGSSPATVTDELYDELPHGVARPVVQAMAGAQQQQLLQRSHASPTPVDAQGRVSHMKTVVASAADSEVVYDVPPQVVRDSGGAPASVASGQRQGPAIAAVSGQRRPAADASGSSSNASVPTSADGGALLPLQLDSAVELLVKLQQDCCTAASRLLSLAANEAWRRRQHLEAIMYDVKMACIGVQTNLQEFVDFAHGACANVANRTAGGDGVGADGRSSALYAHLGALLVPLEERLQVINKSMKALSVGAKWQASRLAVDSAPPAAAGVRPAVVGDDLDAIVSCTRDGLVEAVGRLSAVVKANAAQIFRKCDGISSFSGKNGDTLGVHLADGTVCSSTDGLLPTPLLSNLSFSEHQEYDYIELDACDDRVSSTVPAASTSVPSAGGGRQSGGGNPAAFNTSAADLAPLGKMPSSNAEHSSYTTNGYGSHIVGSDDRQFLSYYSYAIGAIVDSVGDANGRLLAAIRRFESPQQLVSLSRDLVVQAHRLVYIGETLGRSLAHASTRGDIANAANELCNCLKSIIVSTKDVLVVDQSQSNKALQVMIGRSNDLQRAVTQFRVSVTRPIAT